MEVQICKINDSYFCIWFEEGKFFMEDVEYKKSLPLVKLHLVWFVDRISELLQGQSSSFFIQRAKDMVGVVKITKFLGNTEWVMRCIVWLETGGRDIPMGLKFSSHLTLQLIHLRRKGKADFVSPFSVTSEEI